MFEGSLRTKSKFSDLSNLDTMIFIHSFTYARWRNQCSPHSEKSTGS